ncbi:MAG: hypothetical protein KKB75_00120 [Alphaproteobacteria bacterium]|nr:hypothetical protein [Alphaproteobacteria bacterium]MBU2195069.1 hypothetical protein [Alphaproteobacteria bacterium]
MIRLVISALIVLLTATPAFAWDSSPAYFGLYSCMGKTPKQAEKATTCISPSSRYLKSEAGPVEVRYRQLRARNAKELKALFAAQGLDETVIAAVAARKGLSEKEMIEKLIVRGVVTVEGQRDILPPVYPYVFPISDRIFLVRRFDETYGLINLNESPAAKPIDIAFDDVIELDEFERKPLRLIFEGRSTQGYLRYTMISSVDGSVTRIDNVVGGVPDPSHSWKTVSKYARKDFWVFGPEYIGFNVRINPQTPAHTPEINTADALVVVNTDTGYIERMDTPMQWILLPYKGNIYDGVWTAMYPVGNVKEGLEISGRPMLLPYDETGAPIESSFLGQPLIGMVPFVRDEYQWKNGLMAAEIWALAYADGDDLTFRMVEAFDFDLANPAPPSNKLAEVSDVWLGRSNGDDVQDLLTEEERASDYGRTVIDKEFFAVKDVKQSADAPHAAYSLPEWAAFGIRADPIKYRNVTQNMQSARSFFSDAGTDTTPQEAVNAHHAIGIRQSIYNDPSAVKARAQAALERQNEVYLAAARRIMSGAQNTVYDNATLQKAALLSGGDIVSFYYNKYRNLPDVPFASKICGKFGPDSNECQTLQPWLNAYWAEKERDQQRELERNTARAAGDAYAREQAMTRKSYTGPKKPEIQYCWSENGFWNC